MRYNAQKDIVQPYIGDLWSTNFLGTSIKDEYNEPLERTGEKWWTGLQEAVAEIFVVGGSDEILVDPIRKMAKMLEVSTIQSFAGDIADSLLTTIFNNVREASG